MVSDNPGVGREIRFNRSANFGATWQASDTVWATLGHPAGYFAFVDWPAVDLETPSSGTVYVAWSAAPDPLAHSLFPRVAADGTGNVWACWLNDSAGLSSLVARRSGDAGATFGPIYRLDRKTPQGGDFSTYFASPFVPPYGSVTATLPGVAFFGWAAERESYTLDALLNAYDVNDCRPRRRADRHRLQRLESRRPASRATARTHRTTTRAPSRAPEPATTTWCARRTRARRGRTAIPGTCPIRGTRSMRAGRVAEHFELGLARHQTSRSAFGRLRHGRTRLGCAQLLEAIADPFRHADFLGPRQGLTTPLPLRLPLEHLFELSH